MSPEFPSGVGAAAVNPNTTAFAAASQPARVIGTTYTVGTRRRLVMAIVYCTVPASQAGINAAAYANATIAGVTQTACAEGGFQTATTPAGTILAAQFTLTFVVDPGGTWVINTLLSGTGTVSLSSVTEVDF